MASATTRNSIVIVSFNSKASLERMLAVLYLAESSNAEVIVVDNDSFDGTPEMLAEHFPAVRLIRMGSNRGFAAAANKGVQQATGDISIICHADLVTSVDVLADLADQVRAAEGRRVVAAVPRLTGPGGHDQPNLGRLPTLSRGLAAVFNPPAGRSAYFPYLDHLANHEWASLACCAIDTGALLHMGGLDERFILYYIEADLCQRLHDGGDRMLVRRDLLVNHLGGPPDALVDANKTRIMRKDQMTFFQKHRPIWERELVRAAAKLHDLTRRGSEKATASHK